jgi:hypothetical protein
MEMFAELLSQVRSTFIEDALVEDDTIKKNNLRRCESEPWMSTQFRWDIDTIEKGSDSDSTQDPQNEIDSSDSCFEDVGWYRLSTAEFWPDDDSQWEPDMEQAMRVAGEARSDPFTNVTSSVGENRSDAEPSETNNRSCLVLAEPEGDEPSNASSLEKAVTKERVRWADVEDDPGHEVRASDANKLVTKDMTARPLPEVSTSPQEASDAISETKSKKTKRRKSLIDKAAFEQQYPRKSKLRSNAPAFVPMAIEATTSDAKRVCKQCGNGGQPNQKLCNHCGTLFPVIPLAFLGGAIIQ